MRQFLILFDEFPINKTSIKSGNNSVEVITAARCVNVGLFVSGNLRRDVVLSLGTGTPENLIVISFPGINLKRVSPDERSVSFFLLKAISLAEEMIENSTKIMDNGIEVRRTSLESFIESMNPSCVYISSPDSIITADEYCEYENSLLIYYPNRGKYDPLQIEDNWILRKLRYVSHPERFIMDVNMSVDMKKAS